jgi:hypothetical protein
MYTIPPEAGEETASLGAFEEALAPVMPLFVAFLRADTPVGRVALGVEHFEAASEVIEAYSILSERIGRRELDLASARDFIYQVNRARQSTVMPDLRINRLAKWSVIKRQTLELNPQTGEQRSVGPEAINALLQTDVNTADEYSVALPHDNLIALLDELVQQTVSLATRGDTHD